MTNEGLTSAAIATWQAAAGAHAEAVLGHLIDGAQGCLSTSVKHRSRGLDAAADDEHRDAQAYEAVRLLLVELRGLGSQPSRLARLRQFQEEADCAKAAFEQVLLGLQDRRQELLSAATEAARRAARAVATDYRSRADVTHAACEAVLGILEHSTPTEERS